MFGTFFAGALGVHPREYFRWGAVTWDVEAADALLKAAPRQTVDVAVAPYMNVSGVIRVDEAHAATLTAEHLRANPVILSPLVPHDRTAGYMLIDGWHRLWKANSLGWEGIPGLLLTHDEGALVTTRL